MPKTAAYLRVSTLDQEKGIASQEKAISDYLEGHGLEAVWYRDRLSGATTKRPEFEQLQRDIFNGKVNTVVVWKLDRVSRSLRDGVEVLSKWLDRGVRIISVSQQLDFSGTVGELVAHILFAIAQMERENLRENTKRGLAAAKAKGVRLGKRPGAWVQELPTLKEEGLSVAQMAKRLGRSRQAVYSALQRAD